MNEPQIGDRVQYYGKGDAIVEGFLAESIIGPLTGNPRYRVVDSMQDVKDEEAGKWVSVENVRGIYPK